MCGIHGVYFADRHRVVGEDLLRAMGDAIHHRGPDESGVLVDGAFGFGMQRLSIIDLKTGHQPIGSEDGSVQVVFNGEIYNYRELAHDLLERGHVLATTSDTEVIVHLWEEYGAECVRHLAGMFAIALWDSRSRTLFLARDRLGIKPLYYAETPAGFVFGSELKALVRVPEVARRVSSEAVLAYLRWGYVPDPLAILEDVRKLPPAHVLTASRTDDGRLEVGVRRYWDLDYGGEKIADEFIHPKPPGHFLVMLQTAQAFGLTEEEVFTTPMLSEFRGKIDFMRGIVYEGTAAEWYAAVTTEEQIGHWSAACYKALTTHYGFDRNKASYFATHVEADLAEHEEGVMGHASFNRMALQRLLQTGMADERPTYGLEYCAMTSVDLHGVMLRAAMEEAARK